VKTNWRGKPVEVFLNSGPGQDVPFRFHVFSLVARLADDGGYAVSDVNDLVRQLTPAGRDGLRRSSSAAEEPPTLHQTKE
jgi:hypothetical protein